MHARKLTSAAIEGLAPWASVMSPDNEHLIVLARSREVLPEILRHLVASGADIFEFRPEQVSLEEQFVTIMGEDAGL